MRQQLDEVTSRSILLDGVHIELSEEVFSAISECYIVSASTISPISARLTQILKIMGIRGERVN